MTTRLRSGLAGLAHLAGERSDAQSPRAADAIVSAVHRGRVSKRVEVGVSAAVAVALTVLGTAALSAASSGDGADTGQIVVELPGAAPLPRAGAGAELPHAAGIADALAAYPGASDAFAQGLTEGFGTGYDAGYAAAADGAEAPTHAPHQPEVLIQGGSIADGYRAGYAAGYGTGFDEGANR